LSWHSKLSASRSSQGFGSYGARIIKWKFIGKNLVHDNIYWDKTAMKKNSCPGMKGGSLNHHYILTLYG
jgi:hypothetical protein